MNTYRILYFDWAKISRDDCIHWLRKLGNTVEVWKHPFSNYTVDVKFLEDLRKKLREGYDFIFSFNYFPLLSRAAQDAGILYFSWVFDSPHYTLQSETLGNTCNRIFLFDYALAQRYREEGFDTVKYLPLACNVQRLDQQLCKKRGQYLHEISFLGSLYNDEYDFWEQIRYLPEYLKGYADALLYAQEQIYGMDLASELLTEEVCAELGKYVSADLGEGFRPCRDEILRNMLRKKVTVNERKNLLRLLGERFSVDLYSSKKPDALPVLYCGYADYRTQMPEIFATSRINLNLTLRSILTGIPLRVIDILGAGGFCLTNYQAELPEYFENGRELVWFESAEELIDRAEYYLSHEEERARIASAGHEAALQDFSYAVQLPKMLAEA